MATDKRDGLRNLSAGFGSCTGINPVFTGENRAVGDKSVATWTKKSILNICYLCLCKMCVSQGSQLSWQPRSLWQDGLLFKPA